MFSSFSPMFGSFSVAAALNFIERCCIYIDLIPSSHWLLAIGMNWKRQKYGTIRWLLDSTHTDMNLNTLLRGFNRSVVIDSQIEDYVSHKARTAPTMAPMELPILKRFARFSAVRDAGEIEIRHLRDFEQLLKNQEATKYAEDRALRSLRGFLRYHHARGHLCPAPEAVGQSSYQKLIMSGATA